MEEPGPVIELLKAEKLLPVVVFAEDKIQDFPDVPTTRELGAEVFLGVYRGIMVKKGTPRPIVDFLHEAFKKSMETDFYKNYERASYLHLRPGYLSPDDLDKFLAQEAAMYTKELKKTGEYKIKK